jgi:hypothetical protein
LGAHGLEGNAERFQRLGSDTFSFVDQAEEDVLGPDVGVVEESCFFLREHDDAPSPVGKAFEQFDRPSPLPFSATQYCK